MTLRLNFKIFWILSLFSLISLLVFYIIQVGSLAREKYLLQNYENRLGELAGQNTVLEVDFSKSNSLNNLPNHLEALGFERANNIKYLQILGEVVRK